MNFQKGDSGLGVKNCQYTLHMLTYNVNGIDGSFGPGMENAVRLYQQNNGLTVTGIISEATWGHMQISINAIKKQLNKKGYYSVSVFYGVGDEELYNAVLAFQRNNGLVVDGMVGPATRVKLYAEGPNNTVIDWENAVLSYGSVGDAVLYLQYGLHVLGCVPGTLDGSFGPAVDTAVRWFQQKYGLTVDGSVGPATKSKMETLIREIQQKLYDLDHDAISIINGIAGPETYNAVCEFQAKNGLSVDGSVGPTTRTVLFGNSTGNTSSTSATDDLPLTQGKTGKNVQCFQYGLHICGFNPNGFDGSFGPGMLTAVKAFQTAHNLTADGSVGPATWDKMRSEILPIQQALKTLGYYYMDADGIANIQTYNGVIAFQTSYVHLIADGMVGPDTRQLLGLSASGTTTATGTVSNVLTKGSNGSLVRYLQKMLNTMGYSLVVDGFFGDTMLAVIKSFQEEHGLAVDGSVGPATWDALFTYYATPAGVLGSALFGDRVAKVAEYELSLGFSEDNANDITPYGEWYGMNGQPWCAMFVSWCAREAGYLGTEVPQYAYCPYGKAWYVQRGRYYARTSGYIPKRGDVIFFWSGTEISHTGIVVAATSNTVTTIEGNASRKVKSCTYDLTNAYIDGYGTFSVTEITPLTPTEKNNAISETIIHMLEDLGISYEQEFEVGQDIVIPAGIFTMTISTSMNIENKLKQIQNEEYCNLTVTNGQIMLEGNAIDSHLKGIFLAEGLENVSGVPQAVFKIGSIVHNGEIYLKVVANEATMEFRIVFEQVVIARDNLEVRMIHEIKFEVSRGLYEMELNWANAKAAVDSGKVFNWTVEDLYIEEALIAATIVLFAFYVMSAPVSIPATVGIMTASYMVAMSY